MLKEVLENNAKVRPDTDFLNELQQHFPQFFDKDGNFNNEKFLTELRENNIAEARDGYRLSFVGKDYGRLQTGRASETMITPDIAHNSKPENADSRNIFITGDNLEALRHLQNAYKGKVKLIYIDPPYNTGKEFVYPDNFEFDDEKLKNSLGYSDEEIARLKSIQGKSSHSAWLTFMYPRLKLAKKLLTDDGVIFVSIDDNEQANLKLLMDDVFGEGNFVGNIIWERAYSPVNLKNHFSENHDYIVCYAYHLESLICNGLQRNESTNDRYQNPDNDSRGVWKSTDLSVGPVVSDKVYEIETPSGRKVLPPSGRCWVYTKDKFLKLLNENRIWFGKEGNSVPSVKKFLSEVKQGITPMTIWKYSEVGHSQNAAQKLKDLFDGKDVFDYPKSIGLIKRCLKLYTDENSMIMDFFAGSATTAHAVMQLNAEDGGNRKFIMVQLDEETNPDSEARKAGYKTIDEISRERIKRAAMKIKSENPMFADDRDLGFKHYRLTTPVVKTLDKITEFNPEETNFFGMDMISGTGGLDTILTTWLIDGGNTFDTRAEEIILSNYTAQYIAGSKTLYLINEGFDTEALKAMLNKTGTGELPVSSLVVYPYSFGFGIMRELEIGVKSLNNVPQIIKNY